MKNKRKYLKKERGITLIALVITIIVLLILAGVSIAMVTGDNGILTQAAKAKEETEKAQDKEKIKLAVSEAIIYNDGNTQLDSIYLQKAINNQFGENQAIVADNGDGTFTVEIIDNQKNYIVTSNDVENGIDWQTAMQTAKAPAEQIQERNKNVIGIGTDGKPVNMDLWEYTLVKETYCLNSEYSLEAVENSNWDNVTSGYLRKYY